MWSEDPRGTTPQTKEEPKDERKAERVSETPRRWFFGFDAWGFDAEQGEFVLA